MSLTIVLYEYDLGVSEISQTYSRSRTIFKLTRRGLPV